jgi:hypothetical protein
MNRVIAYALLLGSLAVPGIARADDLAGWTGEIEFTKICDVRPHTPISSRCAGFVMALTQVADMGLFDPKFNLKVCIPLSETVEQVVIKMRPWFRKHSETCDGKCDAATFALDAMKAAYPCK